MLFKSEIENQLLPLFRSKKCAILDAPTYSNVGDQLIWAGMESFFLNNHIECVHRCTCDTFLYKGLSIDTVVCLVGGGNFGDMWRGLQELKNKIVQLYPNNKVVIFPQSVFYNDNSLLEFDSEILAKHKDLYICARDTNSFKFLKKHFKNHVLLVPDMALYLSFNQLQSLDQCNKILLMQREDKEKVDFSIFVDENVDVFDWPTRVDFSPIQIESFMHQNSQSHKIIRLALRLTKKELLLRIVYFFVSRKMFRFVTDAKQSISNRWKYLYMEINYLLYLNKKNDSALNGIVNSILFKYHLPLIIEYAVDFISRYDEIYTTRLHGGVLALLLGKKVHLIDNNYGKISALYNTWLLENPNVEILK